LGLTSVEKIMKKPGASNSSETTES
jgi:hypothetical protein